MDSLCVPHALSHDYQFRGGRKISLCEITIKLSSQTTHNLGLLIIQALIINYSINFTRKLENHFLS
jgi:hypothetical protein